MGADNADGALAEKCGRVRADRLELWLRAAQPAALANLEVEVERLVAAMTEVILPAGVKAIEGGVPAERRSVVPRRRAKMPFADGVRNVAVLRDTRGGGAEAASGCGSFGARSAVHLLSAGYPVQPLQGGGLNIPP